MSAGLLSELRAARYIRRAGYRVVKTRFRAAGGEIDIIALDKNALCFIEIKAGALGEAAGRAGRDKRARIASAAQSYLSRHPAQSVRFDVLEESAAGFRLIKNAF